MKLLGTLLWNLHLDNSLLLAKILLYKNKALILIRIVIINSNKVNLELKVKKRMESL